MPIRQIFTRCIAADPLTICPTGSNPGAHALITRSAPEGEGAPTGQQASETDDMSINLTLARSLALMDDVTRAHFAGLDDEKATAFLERTTDEQKAEAHEIKRAADEAKATAAAEAAGKSVSEAALERRVSAQDEEIAALRAENIERAFSEEARHADFGGFPGGADEVIKRLKAIRSFDADSRALFLNDMRAQAANARRTGLTDGSSTLVDVSVAMPVTARVTKAAEERAKTDGCSVARALVLMSKEPAYKADFEAMHAEDLAAAS